jgi:hypothetical protein
MLLTRTALHACVCQVSASQACEPDRDASPSMVFCCGPAGTASLRFLLRASASLTDQPIRPCIGVRRGSPVCVRSAYPAGSVRRDDLSRRKGTRPHPHGTSGAAPSSPLLLPCSNLCSNSSTVDTTTLVANLGATAPSKRPAHRLRGVPSPSAGPFERIRRMRQLCLIVAVASETSRSAEFRAPP